MFEHKTCERQRWVDGEEDRDFSNPTCSIEDGIPQWIVIW